MNCIFCRSDGPFNTREHIIPESLGNDDLILEGFVCDSCQNYFGKEVEQFVLGKTPFAAWRTLLGIRSKSGKLPRIDLSQPKTPKGKMPDKHKSHDDGVIFESHPDGSVSVEMPDEMIKERLSGIRSDFRFVMTPKVLCMLGRFLGKIGLELICHNNPEDCFRSEFDKLRSYARRGTTDDIWPLFYFSSGRLEDLVWLETTEEGVKEEVLCYSYALLPAHGTAGSGQDYCLLHFTIGTDNWVICLNDPYPHPVISEQFPGSEIKVVWYSKEQWKT